PRQHIHLQPDERQALRRRVGHLAPAAGAELLWTLHRPSERLASSPWGQSPSHSYASPSSGATTNDNSGARLRLIYPATMARSRGVRSRSSFSAALTEWPAGF